MHPDHSFHPDAPQTRALLDAMIDEIGFGMVFAATPDGPRVAHTPLIYDGADGSGRLRFHLGRGNALTRHLAGATALALVNGPDGYVAPRWYASPDQVPTWNYVALEMEGPVRRLDDAGLLAMLAALSARQEARIAAPGPAWTLDKLPEARRRALLAGIIGFEMEVRGWRPTLKLSQNKSAEDRAGVIAGLEAEGASGIAALMRALGEAAA